MNYRTSTEFDYSSKGISSQNRTRSLIRIIRFGNTSERKQPHIFARTRRPETGMTALRNKATFHRISTSDCLDMLGKESH